MARCEAHEWSLRWHNWSIGIVRGNNAQWFIVLRMPEGRGCRNTFYPITQCDHEWTEWNLIIGLKGVYPLVTTAMESRRCIHCGDTQTRPYKPIHPNCRCSVEPYCVECEEGDV